MPYSYYIKVTNVHDGDSLTADIDLGFHFMWRDRKIRLGGVETPEVRGDQKPAGIVVRDYVRRLIKEAETIWITSIDDTTHKYGSILASVHCDDFILNERLIELGFAKPYHGGKKEEWTKEELNKILSYADQQ